MPKPEGLSTQSHRQHYPMSTITGKLKLSNNTFSSNSLQKFSESSHADGRTDMGKREASCMSCRRFRADTPIHSKYLYLEMGSGHEPLTHGSQIPPLRPPLRINWNNQEPPILMCSLGQQATCIGLLLCHTYE